MTVMEIELVHEVNARLSQLDEDLKELSERVDENARKLSQLHKRLTASTFFGVIVAEVAIKLPELLQHWGVT